MKILALIFCLLLNAASVHASAIFESANSEFFFTNTPPVTTYPFTISVWMKTGAETANYTGVSITDKDADDQLYAVLLAGLETGDPAWFCTRSGGGGPTCGGSSGFDFAANTWYHLCGVFASATSRAILVNGANKGTETTNITPTGIDSLAVGAWRDTSPINFMEGRIAHVAVWDVALSDGNCASLASSDNPLTMDPTNLIAYWPLLTNANDAKGSNHLTAQGTISFDGDNPTVDAPPSGGTRRQHRTIIIQ